MRLRRLTRALRRALCLALALTFLPVTLALGETGTVNTAQLVMRKSASTSASAIQTISFGDTVRILSSSGEWYRVKFGRYTGYVLKRYINKNVPASSNEPFKVGEENGLSLGSIPRPSPCEPGDTGTNVEHLQMVLKLENYYSGKIDGIYGKKLQQAVKKVQRKYKLKQDGIASAGLIGVLYGEDISESDIDYKTERLDWFKNGNRTIPKGATFQVKDCATGRVFNVKRWSGGNHMDCEPLTAADTAIIKNVYGGKFSWNRRAILIKYKGHVYAASMNFLPHGTGTIKNNNFGGHFCIHTYKSKTHGTKRVDENHQHCVSVAMKYKW